MAQGRSCKYNYEFVVDKIYKELEVGTSKEIIRRLLAIDSATFDHIVNAYNHVNQNSSNIESIRNYRAEENSKGYVDYACRYFNIDLECNPLCRSEHENSLCSGCNNESELKAENTLLRIELRIANAKVDYLERLIKDYNKGKYELIMNSQKLAEPLKRVNREEAFKQIENYYRK